LLAPLELMAGRDAPASGARLGRIVNIGSWAVREPVPVLVPPTAIRSAAPRRSNDRA